ncbi:33339_t:CDS:2 [Gigaspora margarita]|uniref:33339_t:CDS:1 n=1 Tax=Gigaspora margarita TaxID=4874 RepID=A0ABN7V714_GIGMA|nr:33339_t:CDS:2 [Gigaspora margarita]
MSYLFIAFGFTKNVTNYSGPSSSNFSFEGTNVLAPKDLPNSLPLLTYTANVVSNSYISDNQEFELDLNLNSIEEKYTTMSLQITQKRLKFNQHELLNNKYLSNKATSLNFVDLISQIQKGTPLLKQPMNTNQKISSYASHVEDEDDTLINDDDSTELLHVQPQSITSNTKGKRA